MPSFAGPLSTTNILYPSGASYPFNIALISEQAGEASDRSLQRGATEWTDAALGDLDPSATLLVRSPIKLFRLYEAQLVEGVRPDVIVVPTRLLGRGSVSADLAATERDIEPLLRSIALTGSSNEFSLSKLSDARPLFVELDQAWDQKETSHLTISGLWLRFAPQPLGAVDRKMSGVASMVALERLLAAVAPDAWPDPGSTRVAEDVVRQQVTFLIRTGDAHTAGLLLSLARKSGAHGGLLQGSSIAVRIADIVSRIDMGHPAQPTLTAKSTAEREELVRVAQGRPTRTGASDKAKNPKARAKPAPGH